ncbi:MAG: sulfate transporter CysZ [Gammaproteobacteria bacterium]|nr:sulfate transporter CysZ [Gammaproteobacteria bacterium]
MKKDTNNPVIGFNYLLRGFGLLNKPGLWPFVVIPLLVNILVFSLMLWIGIDQFEVLMDHYVPREGWLSWFRWLLWPLFAIAFLLILFFGFTLLANLIGAPFNDLLAERVEIHLTGEKPEQRLTLMKSIAPAIGSELVKITYFLTRGLPLLLLFLIPGVNIIAPFVWGAFAVWMLANEYAEYPMGNNEIYFKQQRQFLKRRRLTSMGFGGGVMLMMMIPIVNFMIMPAAVAGATLWWVERLKPALLAEKIEIPVR